MYDGLRVLTGSASDAKDAEGAGRVGNQAPASQDLDRARRFYAERLGLEPSEERPGGLLYRCGGVEFALFESARRPLRARSPRWAGRSTTSTRRSQS